MVSLIKKMFFVLFIMLSFNVTANAPDTGWVMERDEANTIDWMVDASYGKKLSRNKAAKILQQVNIMSNQKLLDRNMVLAVMATESGFRQNVRSSGNAKGLMQVIEYWHRDKIKGRNIYALDVNIDVGTSILAEYRHRAKGDERRALKMYRGWVDTKRYIRKIESKKEVLDFIALS